MPLTLRECGANILVILTRQTLVFFNSLILLVSGLGYQMDEDPLIGNETLTRITMDPDYACTIFSSC